MVIQSDSDRVKKARNLNIEMLFAEHIEKCATCIWRVNCRLLDLAERYKIIMTTFKDRKGNRRTYKLGEAIEIDGTQCIDCRNCVDACSKMQKIGHLELVGKGSGQEIVPTNDKKKPCIHCGQCALHCPVGSAQEQSSWETVEKALKDPEKIVIAQISAASLAGVCDEFKDCPGEPEQIASAIRTLGFKFVFDQGFADIIYANKAARAVLDHKHGETIYTSSCPAWKRYIEGYHPLLRRDLLPVKSPFLIGGMVIKKHWAKHNGIDPGKIFLVSILPCTAAKQELSEDRGGSVDAVITVRELAWLIKKNRIEIKDAIPGHFDRVAFEAEKAPLLGVSGGEAETILSAASYLSRNRKNDKLEQERDGLYGKGGIRGIEVELAGRKFDVAVVDGIGNIKDFFDRTSHYDFVEVRACSGGCVGGGGQAVPTTDRERKVRAERIKKMAEGVKPIFKEVEDWLKKTGLDIDL